MPYICVICTDKFDGVQTISAVICGHMFHTACLLRWTNENPTNKTCPECRRQVNSHDIFKLFPNNVDTEPDNTQMANHMQEAIKRIKEITAELYQSNKNYYELANRLKNAEKQIHELQQKKMKVERDLFNVRIENEHLTAQTQFLEICRLENERLQSEITKYDHIKTVMHGYEQEIKTIVENEIKRTNVTNYGETVQNMGTYIITMKKELEALSTRKNKLVEENLQLRSSKEHIARRHSKLKYLYDVINKENKEWQDKLAEFDTSSSSRPKDLVSSAAPTAIVNEDLPITVSFGGAHNRIEVINLDDNNDACSSSAAVPAVVASDFPSVTPTRQIDSNSVTRYGYDGLGGQKKIVLRMGPKFIRRVVMKK